MNNLDVCVICNCEIPESETHCYDRKNNCYCEECSEIYLVECSVCGEMISYEEDDFDFVRSQGGGWLCRVCLVKN